jgi:hypothetical protein
VLVGRFFICGETVDVEAKTGVGGWILMQLYLLPNTALEKSIM